MRNPNPFTERQLRLLEAVREKIRQINDPEPEIIIDESYTWFSEQTKQFGQIPKIRFRPNSGQTKAELVRQAGLVDETREERLIDLRQKYGIGEVRNREARLFESEWNNIMLKLKKATFAVALTNQFFATSQQTLADPIGLLQQIALEEYAHRLRTKKDPIHPPGTATTAEVLENEGMKPYDEELADVK
jgi:hypothetical protein